ncbi:hypothetical protein [Proteiniphilum sp. X52]|uniref:hypothetical protein n=1 Tax=Proteiniphilum sp. X52 TaxID=2382159 RepID=UPI000F0A69E5|nr:hypothetical protein [Proteiniphilum sp. X52]RNC66458.1 hypothetical protein D7D25_02980 [Proteiniphilum sp. X52]
MISVDLTKNPKQAEYFITSMAAAQGVNDYKFLNYGGGVRGGKTFVTLAILIRLSEVFPNSRWHVIRKDMPSLESTTIPSFEKIVIGSKRWKPYRDRSNYHYKNTSTGSKIFFKAENIIRDPNLMSFLGLETNGFFLEQSEELSNKLWEKAIERTGSWYLPKMPRGLIFMTFNPTQNWVKDKIYTPWISGVLPPEYFFMSALPGDNAFVTDDQFAGWDMMAERYKKQFIEGDWTDFDSADGRWAFAFRKRQHVGKTKLNNNHPIYLSFDFNRNPITCTVWQHYDRQIFCIDCIKLKDATIHRLCAEIKDRYHGSLMFVTGDASGDNKTTLSVLTNFGVIKNALGLSDTQMQYSASNPRLQDSRMLVNTLFEKYPITIDEDNCKPVIDDLEKCKANPDGTIVKSRLKEEQQADTLDTVRYYLHRYFRDMIKFFD